jgi:uncharacterized RDD family membrane protein YckC
MTGGAMPTFALRTPERVEFRYEIAGPVERLCAWLIDLACWVALLGVIALPLLRAGSWGLALLFVAQFVVQWGYFVFFEWRWAGATPGKRLFGLRVIQTDGLRCSLERVVLRNFLRIVDWLPALYGVGGLSALLSRRGARLGDLAAGTVVVRVPEAPHAEAVAEIRTRFNSLRDDAAVRARIAQRLGPDEAALAIGLALRRERLAERPRLDLVSRTAALLRKRLALPGLGTLPDERVVLGVAAVLLEDKDL